MGRSDVTYLDGYDYDNFDEGSSPTYRREALSECSSPLVVLSSGALTTLQIPIPALASLSVGVCRLTIWPTALASTHITIVPTSASSVSIVKEVPFLASVPLVIICS